MSSPVIDEILEAKLFSVKDITEYLQAISNAYTDVHNGIVEIHAKEEDEDHKAFLRGAAFAYDDAREPIGITLDTVMGIATVRYLESSYSEGVVA